MKKRIIAFAIVTFMIISIMHVSAFAFGETFDPKITNECYDEIIKKSHSDVYDEAIKEIERIEATVDINYDDSYDDSIVWGLTGANRALLVTSLANDLKEYDEELYQKYISEASEYYVGITRKTDDIYNYVVSYIGKKNGILLLYVPGSTLCKCTEIEKITSFLTKDAYSPDLKVKEWSVTEDDFSEMMGIIEASDDEFSTKIKISPLKPNNTPSETYSYSNSELEKIAKDRARLELKSINVIYDSAGWDTIVDSSKTEIQISSVTKTLSGWTVAGEFRLHSYTGHTALGTFTVDIPNDSDAKNSICKINSIGDSFLPA